jgi:hypothetical protein
VEQRRTWRAWRTHFPEDSENSPIAGHFEGPARFSVTFDVEDPPATAGLRELSLDLELSDDRYVITRVEAVAPEGGRIDLETLRRFNYSAALRDALRHDVVSVPMSREDRIAVQLGETTPDPLERAAYVYTLARLVGESPTKAVADAQGISAAAAAQRVRRARQKGLLPPAASPEGDT